MNLKLSYELTTRLLALAGALSVIQTGDISLVLSGATLIGLAMSMVHALQGRSAWLSPKTWNLVNVIILVYFVLDYFFVSNSWLVAVTHFTLLLMLNKLFNLNTHQDHFQLFLISLLQLLAASTFSIDFSFAVIFVFFLLTAVWALLLHHLSVQARLHGTSLSSQRTMVPFFTTNFFALLTLASTLALFFLIPRVGIGLLKKGTADLVNVSGFNEEVDLGEIGPAILDPTVVMRAQVTWKDKAPKKAGFYWRGMVFDHYDGRSWKNSFGKGPESTRDFSGRVRVNSQVPGRPVVYQEIMLEPLDTTVLFIASQPLEIQGDFTKLKKNSADALNLLFTPSKRMSYSAISQIPVLDPRDLNLASLDIEDRTMDYYLQLPPNRDRIVQLGLRITDPIPTIYQKVSAVLDYLKKNYNYSLDVGSADPDSPIESFLFESKVGYCEQYASAMALLLRSAGIPTRLITGFLSGEFNEYGDYYTIRNSNSHAWVEVWFPASGWMVFDPTPSTAGRETPALWTAMTEFIDVLQWRWNRYFVYYTSQDQFMAVKTVRRQGYQLGKQVDAALVGIKRWISARVPERVRGPWGGIGLFAAIGVIAILLWRNRKFARVFRGREMGIRLDPSVDFYRRLLALLSDQGFSKPGPLTPLEFCRVLREPRKQSLARKITVLYYRVRFGGIPLTRDEIQDVERTLSDINTAPTASISH